MRRHLLDRARKEFLHALKKRLFPGMMAALLQGFREFFEQFFLLGFKAHRCSTHDPAEQIAGGAAAHRAHAFLAHAKYAARLGLAGDFQNHFAIERGDLDRAAERRRDKGDGYFAGQMTALALEERMLLDPNLDIDVAGGSPVSAGPAPALQTQASASVSAPGPLDPQSFFLPDTPLPLPRIARIWKD